MKNNLEAGSGKIRRTDNALYTRFTPDKVLVGMISLILLLLSLIGAIATLTMPHAIAASAIIGPDSGMKHTLSLDDTSTPTTTPTLTSTPSLTATPTIIPTSTLTSMPSPTSTSISSPTASTTIVTTPPPTSLTPSISPTHASSAAIANATRGATATPQSLVPGQTATTTSNSTTPQSTSQEQQKSTFPFIALAIGVPGMIATLVFLLIGWWLLRKRLLPNNTAKLPPSGANPWSRVRPSDRWDTNVNGAFQPDGNNAQLSNSQVPLENNSIAPTGIPFNKNGALPYSNIVPTPNGFIQTNTNSLTPSADQFPPNELNLINNAKLIPASKPVTSETNIPQVLGKNGNSANTADAYEQWLQNNSAEIPDSNDPYLRELIKEFSNKTQAAHQQNLSNSRNE